MTIETIESAQLPDTTWRTVDDLVYALGDIPLGRIFMTPTPGTATAADMIRMVESKVASVELVDGTLVEKPMGDFEDAIGFQLGIAIGTYVNQHTLGMMNGSQGMRRMLTGNILMPDVMFTAIGRLTYKESREQKTPAVAPDLSVEVLSKANTKREMLKKRRQLFAAGTRLIWEVEPKDKTFAVYTSAETPDVTLDAAATLTGGDVLPGFTLDLAPFWAQFDD